MAGILIKKCCCATPCVDCPDCSCFVDTCYVAVPAMEFDSLSPDAEPIHVTIPAIDVEMPIVACEATGTYDDSPVGLDLQFTDPGADPVTGHRIEVAAGLACVDCDCVAYWCQQISFRIYGDVGLGEELLYESVAYHGMNLAPTVDPDLCDPPNTHQGDYDMIVCATAGGAPRLCCAQFNGDAICTDVQFTVTVTS